MDLQRTSGGKEVDEGRGTNPPTRITPTCRVRPGFERLTWLDMVEKFDLRRWLQVGY